MIQALNASVYADRQTTYYEESILLSLYPRRNHRYWNDGLVSGFVGLYILVWHVITQERTMGYKVYIDTRKSP